MIGCSDLQRGESLTFGHLFAGFKTHFGVLFVVGLLFTIYVIVFGMASLMTIGTLGIFGAKLGIMGGLTSSLSILGVLFIIPMLMAMWFAPALIVLHDLGAVKALMLSFQGSMRNIMPLIIFGIFISVLSLVATITLSRLGWWFFFKNKEYEYASIVVTFMPTLVWVILTPFIVASQYVAYREIFVD
jgi:hypothetical protein